MKVDRSSDSNLLGDQGELHDEVLVVLPCPSFILFLKFGHYSES